MLFYCHYLPPLLYPQWWCFSNHFCHYLASEVAFSFSFLESFDVWVKTILFMDHTIFLYICNHLAVVAKEEKSIRVIWGKRVPFYWTKNVCTFLRDQTKQETRVQKLVIAQPAAWPNSSLLLETRRRHGRFCHKFDLFHSKLSCKTLSSQNHMPLLCTLNSISYNNQQLSETLL